jgi:hypothetical protein
MNRTFKRLAQGGVLNVSDTVIKFTFEGKTYSALQGDTLESALLSNNILNYGRTRSGQFLTSTSRLYSAISSIDTPYHSYTVSIHDFMLTDGLQLSQTNKMTLKKKILSLAQFFTNKEAIPNSITPITADSLTRYLIDNDTATEDLKKFTENMVFNIEKSYLHTDVVITGVNIFALQAALIYANAGLKVILCDSAKDIAYNVFYNAELHAAFNTLKTKAYAHPHITISKMTDICIAQDKQHKNTRIVGLNRCYAYTPPPKDISVSEKPNNQGHHNIELSVIHAPHIILAPSLQEMGFLFQGHHLPAVMGCREFIDLHIKFGLIPNANIVLYVSNDMAYDILTIHGIAPDTVNAIIDTRQNMTQTMINAEKSGYKLYAGYVITHATGKNSVESVTLKSIQGDKEGLVKSVACDLLLHSSGYDLDLSILNNMPEAIKISVSDDARISMMPDLEKLSDNHLSIIGYTTHNANTPQESYKSVYDQCHEFLKSQYNVTAGNDDDTYLKPQITSTIIWQHPDFYGLHDLCRKEHVFFPQNIHYSNFIQTLYRYDNPLVAIEALKQNHNFYGNHHAIRILLSQMQKIYNFKPNEIAVFYADIVTKLACDFGLPPSHILIDTLSVCGKSKLHILPSCDTGTHIYKTDHNHNLITPDYAMSALEIHDYYHKIKEYAGIRAFNDRDMIDISGSDALQFMHHVFEKTAIEYKISDTKNLSVGHHLFIQDKNCKTPILLMHYAENRFCLIIPHKTNCADTFQNVYDTYAHLKLAVHKLNQSWTYLQIIGDKATQIFEKMTKTHIALLPADTVNLWIENIQLRFVMYNRYNIPHIDIMIASDAAASLYQKLISDGFGLAPFSQPIYDMIALEAGHIFDMPLMPHHLAKNHNDSNTLFTTQALAMPLASTHTSLYGGDVFPESYQDTDVPQGIMLPNMVFSPHYNQYLVPTLLKGDFQQWENKIVSVVNKDKHYAIQVKIISDKMLKIQEVA